MRPADNCIQSFVFCHAPHEGTSERMKAFFTVRMKIGEAKRRADMQIILQIILFCSSRIDTMSATYTVLNCK